MLTQEQKQRIDNLFTLWEEAQGAGGQLVIVHKGETVYEQCYCYANDETKEPITQDSIFSVASVSKQITAMSIMILHERGLLNIADDVRKYLPEFENLKETVTISHLLHHTSGIRECFGLNSLHDKKPGHITTVPHMIRLCARQKELNFTPGSEFSYCNSGYMMLATIVERVSGMTFNEFATENIFKPLGMNHSLFRDQPDMVIPNHVKGHDDNGINYRVVPYDACTFGSGGLRTNCRDLVKFMPQYVNPTLISKELMEKTYLHIPPLADGTVTNYACGVRINDLLGHKYYHHGGVTAGFRAFTVIFPDDELVIAIATNTYNIPIETAGRDIARIVLGLPERERMDLEKYRDPNATPVPGFYRNPRSGRQVTVRVEDGQVQVRFMGKWQTLDHLGDNIYKLGRRDISFAFGENVTINQEQVISVLEPLTGKAADPESYVGTYYNDEVQGTITARVEDGEIILTEPNGGIDLLQLLEGDSFCSGSLAGYGETFTFTRDESGQVTGLVYHASQIYHLLFTRQ